MTVLDERAVDDDVTVGVPGGWVSMEVAGVALTALEPVAGPFVANVTVVVDAASTTPTVASAATVLNSVVALVAIDVSPVDPVGVEMLFCHLVGTESVTSLQRQIPTRTGVVTVTVSCATGDWPRLSELASTVVASVREAS